IETLADQNAVARSGAANTLGSIQHRTVVRPLGRLLFDQDEKVRECAGYALYKLAQGDPGGTNWRPSDRIADPQEAAKIRAENHALLRKLAIEELNAALRSGN